MASTKVDTRAARGFFDRRDEFELLLEGLEDAAQGRTRMLLIGGEPGIGKTRLATEFAERAREQSARVVWGRCREEGGGPPFWPWTQIVRSLLAGPDPDALLASIGSSATHLAQIVPSLLERFGAPPTSSESAHARFYLFDAVTQLVRQAARTEPVVMILDDLHWADRDSLQLLRFFAQDPTESHLLTVALFREVEARTSPPVAETIGELARVGATVSLGGLPSRDVADLVARTTGAAPPPRLLEEIVSTTRGNPFFVDELTRLLSSEGKLEESDGGRARRIPQGVRQLVERRVASLSEDCRDTLIVASVIGRSFSMPLLAATVSRDVGTTIELLDAAAAAAIVEPDSTRIARWSFVHALYRESLYASLSESRRLDLHRRVGEALEKMAGAELDAKANELAFHFRLASPAGSAEKAVAYAQRAGRCAAEECAYDESVAHFRAALDVEALLPVRDNAQHIDLLLELGEVQRRAGDVASAASRFSEAAAMARRLGFPDRVGRAALHLRGAPGTLGDAYEATGRVDGEVVALLEEALAGIPPQDSPLRARLLGRLASSLYWDPKARQRREELSRAAVEMANRLGDPLGVVVAMIARRYALWTPDNAVARLAEATEILELAERIGDHEHVLFAREMRLWDFVELCDLRRFEPELEAYQRTADALRQPFFLGDARMFRATLCMLRGEFAAGEGLAAEAFALAERAQNPLAAVFYGGQLFRSSWEQGRTEMLEAAVAGIRAGSDLAGTRCALAFVLAELGRAEEARVELDRFAERHFEDVPFGHGWLGSMALLGRVCATIGDRDRARELYERLRPYADINVTAGPPPFDAFGPTAHILGLLAATFGDAEAAIAHFEKSIDLSLAMGAIPFVADGECELAKLLLARGEVERGTRLLEKARSRAEDRGLERIAASVRAVGATLPAQPAREEAPPSPAVVANAVFLREGEIWRIAYDGKEVRLRDSRGLRYLARLLGEPGRDVHSAELASGGGIDPEVGGPVPSVDEAGGRAGLGDAGEMLDVRARDAYRARLDELRSELAQATEWGDKERASRLQAEIDFIAGEIAAAYGIGGRARKAADSTERARKAVANRIRDAVTRIEKDHASLGRHLANSVRTGIFCCYQPERPVSWRI